MEIVITNDDGWRSGGIMVLTRAMTQLGHVTVVAPDKAQSGMSSAISVNKELTLKHLTPADAVSEEEKLLIENADIYTTNGTPADCVKLAINAIFGGDDSRIDLLVSGINHGHNASVNILYSGTMGACFVAAEHSIPAIGFSINWHQDDADFSHFEPYILPLTQHLTEADKKGCYNVNAPAGEIKGIRWTRQAAAHWEKELEQHTNENGETYYTLIGEFVNHEPEAQDTDIWCIENGYISIQPVSLDMTDYSRL